jgi:alkanesulfonate monooxygenase SsuD/methylene tetrahydromethanopterin reductase-like flavin-dependent oxidoreductase (luciferase family)
VTAARALMVLTENWTLSPRPTLGDLVELAVEAEAAGVDGVMVSDHVVLGPSSNEHGEPLNLRDYAMPGNQDPATPWPSPYVLLSAIAARTTTLRVVLGAIVSPLRHPLITAKDLGTLDLLAEGRLVVLPTVSWHQDEYAALGVDFHRRGEILDEQLEIWHQVWTSSPVAFHGRHYDFDDVWVEPKANRNGGPVLWFGGSTVHGAVARRLAKYGSGFNPLGRPSVGELRVLDDALAVEGRSRREIEMVGGIRGRFSDANTVASLDEALDGVREQLDMGYSTICFKPSMFTDERDDVVNVCSRVVEFLASTSST